MANGLYGKCRWFLLGAAACGAMAAELPRIGAQVLGSWPTGSMRSEYASRMGYGLGVFADWEVGVGKTLRVGYDGIWYPTHTRTVEVGNVAEVNVPASSDDKCRSHAVTSQLLFYPAESNEGFYYKLGLGAMNYLTRTTTGGGPTVLQETGTKLTCLAGAGYDFSTHWGVMAQYSFITVQNRTLGAIQTGVSYRF